MKQEQGQFVADYSRDGTTLVARLFNEDDDSQSLGIYHSDSNGEHEIATLNSDEDGRWNGHPNGITVWQQDGEGVSEVAAKALERVWFYLYPAPAAAVAPMVGGTTHFGVSEVDRRCAACGATPDWIKDPDNIDTDRRHLLCQTCRDNSPSGGALESILNQITEGRL